MREKKAEVVQKNKTFGKDQDIKKTFVVLSQYWAFLKDKQLNAIVFDQNFRSLPDSIMFKPLHDLFWHFISKHEVLSPNLPDGFELLEQKKVLVMLANILKKSPDWRSQFDKSVAFFAFKLNAAIRLEKVLYAYCRNYDLFLSPFDSHGMLNAVRRRDPDFKKKMDLFNAKLMVFLDSDEEKAAYHYAITGLETYNAFHLVTLP